VAEGKSFKQTPLERNMTILLYLKKFDGEWKNKNEIATYSKGHGLHRKRLDEFLEGLIERGLIVKQEASNPQAKWEYKISDEGKEFFKKLLLMTSDPKMKYLLGVKMKKFDELD